MWRRTNGILDSTLTDMTLGKVEIPAEARYAIVMLRMANGLLVGVLNRTPEEARVDVICEIMKLLPPEMHAFQQGITDHLLHLSD